MKDLQTNESYGVIGLGRFGTALVETLAQAGKDVIVMDKDEHKVKAMRKYTDLAFVVDSIDAETLEETGIHNCDTVAICIGESIDVSILTTMLVIKMGIPHVIAKANSPEHGEVLKHLGATVAYPESDMAVRLGKRLISGNLIDYLSLGDYVDVRRIQVGGALIGRTIGELDVRRNYGINIIAIGRDEQTNVEFSPEYAFKKGDVIAVIGKADKIDYFEKEARDN